MNIVNFRSAALGFALAGLVLAIGLSPGIARAQQPVELSMAAPELVGGPWLNTNGGAAVKLAARKGKVTIVQFWTFG